jgi:carbonic anhydrase
LDRIRDDERRHRRLVELNVIEQCLNLFKTGVVQRRRVETYQQNMASGHAYYSTPRIHACVFDPKVGDLKRLEVDWQGAIADLRGIYDLYHLPDETAEDFRREIYDSDNIRSNHRSGDWSRGRS